MKDDGSDIRTIDGAGGWLLPGFIDMHVHGGYGADFMEANEEAYDTILKFHASKGTTRMLATTVTASHEAIDSVLHAASAYIEHPMPYAALLAFIWRVRSLASCGLAPKIPASFRRPDF